jgi:hypothetical protein
MYISFHHQENHSKKHFSTIGQHQSEKSLNNDRFDNQRKCLNNQNKALDEGLLC